MSERLRAVFMGTPAFAVPALAALADVCEIVAVVSQPDRPSGRGMGVVPTPVKAEAVARGLGVHQPTRVRDGSFAAWLRELRADVALVVAYGRILPPDVLRAPRRGCVNVHASLLPRHRGAAPIQWAVLSGDRETGVSLMQMDEGMDTGPVLAQRMTPIGPDERADELAGRLSLLGAALVREELPRFLAGQLHGVSQDAAQATMAPMLTKEMSRIDWHGAAEQIHAHVRGLQPWPGAATTLAARRWIIHRSSLEQAPVLLAGVPGEVVAVTRECIWVATGAGAVGLTEVQLEGKKRSSARDFLAGHPVRVGMLLGM